MKAPVIEIIVPGEPVAKGRPRFTRQGHAYTPEKTTTAEGNARLFAGAAMAGRPPLEGPLVVLVLAYRAKGLPKPGKTGDGRERREMLEGTIVPSKKPDADNVAKMALDALNGIVWQDDAQCDVLVIRRYSAQPRMEVRVWKYERGEYSWLEYAKV